MVAADFNTDGRMDLASANLNANNVTVLMNGPGVTANYNANFAGTYTGNGSGLTGLAATNLTGTVTLAQLPGTLLTNNSTGVTLTGTFSGSGASLTTLNAGNIASGTLADARLSANVALLNASQNFTGSNTFSGPVLLTNANNTLTGAHSGNGAGLTALNAANLTGTVADARLSANIPLLNANNQFSGTNGLNDRDLRLRINTDANHGLGWYGTGKAFAGFSPNGPVLFGFCLRWPRHHYQHPEAGIDVEFCRQCRHRHRQPC